MKRAAIALILLLLAGDLALSQGTPRVHTQPALPPTDMLERVDLQVHWHRKIRLYSKRDGLASVQVIPNDDANPQLLVQTISGSVLLFDAETGDRLWETTVGDPYQDSQPPGWNTHSILTTRRETLYMLNRLNGSQRLVTPDSYSKLPRYGFPLLAVPSAAPVADDGSVLFCMENRIIAYSIPNFTLIDMLVAQKGTAEEKTAQSTLQRMLMAPAFLWSYLTPDMHFERPLLLTINQAMAVSTDGRLSSFNKLQRLLRYDYHLNKGVSAGMGQHGDMAYVGSHDLHLYALNMSSGRLRWRFTTGAPVDRRPAVNDASVYVSSERHGMHCVEREFGDGRWLNDAADRFIAANPKFVYANDRFGDLLIIEQLRGRALARLPMRDWNVPVSNELNDRLYFAAHDGQIACLRHRDLTQPLPMKSDPFKKPKEPPPDAPAEPAAPGAP